MKRYGIATVCGLVMFGVLASVTIAQDDAPGKPPRGGGEGGLRGRPRRGEHGPRGRRGDPKERAERIYKAIVEKLKLEGDKLAQFRQAWETHQQAVINWHKEHGEELKALRGRPDKPDEGLTDEQRGILALRREKMQKLIESRGPLVENFVKQLGEFLTPEQVQTVRLMIQPPKIRGRFSLLMALPHLGLSEQQKGQVKTILTEAKVQVKEADKPGEKMKILRAAHERIIKEVLNDVQRRKLHALRERAGGRRGRGEGRRRPYGGVELTDEQKAKVQKIIEEERKKGQDGDVDPGQVRENVRKRINEEVLTEEQRKKVQDRRSEMGKRIEERRKEGPDRRGGERRRRRPPEEDGEGGDE